MNRIYVASAFDDYPRTRRAHEALRAHGYEVTHDWTRDADRYPDDETHTTEITDEDQRRFAQEDMDGVAAADAVLVLVPDDRTRGCGMWHEAGGALYGGKTVVYAGSGHRTRTIFSRLARQTFATDEEAVAWLGQRLASFEKLVRLGLVEVIQQRPSVTVPTETITHLGRVADAAKALIRAGGGGPVCDHVEEEMALRNALRDAGYFKPEVETQAERREHVERCIKCGSESPLHARGCVEVARG